MFSSSAVLALPALLSLSLIGGEVRSGRFHNRAVGRERQGERISWQGMKSLLLDKRLAIFAACVVLFFAASAAMGPVVAAQVTRRWPDFATLIVAATILVPQAIVAAISPWIGRRPIVRVGGRCCWSGGGCFRSKDCCTRHCPGPFALVLGNLLNAVSGAIFGVTMTVVAADLTRRTGGFNLTLGALGVAISFGASLSTFFTGISAAAVRG